MIIKKIQELSPEIKEASIQFLLKYELICPQLCSHIKKSESKAYVIFTKKVSESSIYGILLLRYSLLHCLPFSNARGEDNLKKEFVSCFKEFWKSQGSLLYKKNKNIPGCVNGIESGSKLILNAFTELNIIPRQKNHYDLLRLKVSEFSKIEKPELQDEEKIQVCKKDISDEDFNLLLNLQSDYEKEEVLPEFEEFNLENCSLKLKAALKTQLILILKKSDSTIISKAATNAIGYRTVQIGGIYTAPQFRNQHYSFKLLFYFLKNLCKRKKMPVLFVKKDNNAAQALYKSLQFIKITDYVIAYF